MNNVFHATSAHKKNDENSKVFKATSAKSYDPDYVNNLNRSVTISLNKINDYISRRANNEFISKDDISTYRNAINTYSDSSTKLSGYSGNSDTTTDNEWLESLRSGLDTDEETFSAYKDADEYN